MSFEQITDMIRLVVFVIWISISMWLAARTTVQAYNREFTGLILATACLFFGLITGEMWLVGFMAYMGIRTYQKKINGAKPAEQK